MKLIGDFDGSSAFELIHAIKQHCDGVSRIVINTNNLINVYPFGYSVFEKNLFNLNSHCDKLEFVGENVDKIAPEKHFSS